LIFKHFIIKNVLSLQSGSIIMEVLKSYTYSQLALRNGRDRDEVWCACRGYIYDLTPSGLWRGGQHYEHWAGQDLTNELTDAPHNELVFKKFKIVGKLN
jgi:predicted heme/steroid binding protein